MHIHHYDNYMPMVPYMPDKPIPGYSYVPYQINPYYFNNISDAFVYGTIFPELVTPYVEFFQEEVQL